MADYTVYELHPDGTARRPPTLIAADHDAAAYVAAAKIVCVRNAVVEVWLRNNLVWHLEPSPGGLSRAVLPDARQLCEIGT